MATISETRQTELLAKLGGRGSKMVTHKVQGSSSVYTVTLDDSGHSTCYQESGDLCIGWKNSKAPKTCKHVKMALAGKTIGGSAPRAAATADAVREDRSVKPVDPMLASKIEAAVATDWAEWAAEEKFDGHRAIVMVVHEDVDRTAVTAWSRSGKARELPPHVEAAFKTLPNGIYDGELMGKEGGTFADVRRLGNGASAYFVIFDVINVLGENLTGKRYDTRRAALLKVASDRHGLKVSQSFDLKREADIVTLAEAVWERGGEGLILKRKASTYQAGRRSADWVKVKKGGSKVLVVVGFEAGKRGPHSSVVCEDPEDGMRTSVKNESKVDAKPADIGRRVWVDYTEKTAAAFVNPHVDRWEDK